LRNDATVSYKIPILGALSIIGLVIIALILNYFTRVVTGTLSDPVFLHIQFLLVTWGIILPGITLEVAVLGATCKVDSTQIPFLVGSVITTISLLIFLVLGYQLMNFFTFSETMPPEAYGLNVGLIGLISAHSVLKL
jgi:hypothetical protein